MQNQIIIRQFNDAVAEARRLYVDKAIEAVLAKSNLESAQRSLFLDEIELGFNKLIIKIFVEVAWSDLIWSPGETQIASFLVQQITRKPVREKDLPRALERLFKVANEESWQSVLEPFTLLEELMQYHSQLEVCLERIANIVAKVDGQVTAETVGTLKNLKLQLLQFLEEDEAQPQTNAFSYDIYSEIQRARDSLDKANYGTVSQAIDQSTDQDIDTAPTPHKPQATKSGVVELPRTGQPVEKSLDELLEQLDELVGIDAIKSEVRGLVNFLKVQAHRKKAGLPENKVSLHMVFEGNPGTGKTTVGRLLGNILGAMGVLEQGHLIETDRSGLVAEFAGQTATKTNKKIDEALDGVLFIDEAYSLMSDSGQDAYGSEALQILLKRAEDDRDRLIIILAGYSNEMEQMLRSNPGLSSRFARKFTFPDYSSAELLQIFQCLATKNHYVIGNTVEARIMDVIDSAIAKKDDHFGNGHLVRNLFEKTIRNLADRVVESNNITPELLMTLEPCDVTIA